MYTEDDSSSVRRFLYTHTHTHKHFSICLKIYLDRIYVYYVSGELKFNDTF